ncbi:hypothetical protein ACFX2I_022995 [Malus domestica]
MSSTSRSKKAKKTKPSKKMSLLHHHNLRMGGQATVDDLKELNLGTEEEQKPIFVSALLRADEIEEYYQLLSEYKDVFAWTYKEMPDLNPVIVVHHLAVKPGTRPIKQTQRRYRSELIPQIEAEIDKLIEAGFIREVQYPSGSPTSSSSLRNLDKYVFA